MATPKTSVILPVFNGERYLRASIESVLGQTQGDLELAVLDDGSSHSVPGAIARWLNTGNLRIWRPRPVTESGPGRPSAAPRGPAAPEAPERPVRA
jgi:glycosyltransferase involved in cell wall biosynthesis